MPALITPQPARPAPALATRKHTEYGITVWYLPERPHRDGCHFAARPHYALAPRHWTLQQAWDRGLIYLTYRDALIGLGRLASYLLGNARPLPPAAALGDYVRLQHGTTLRDPLDWREQTHTGTTTPKGGPR